MQVYAIKSNYFMRFGSKNNSIVFDLFDEERELIKNGKLTIDQIYDDFKNDPVSRIEKIKQKGIEGLISICGMIGNDFDFSNGTGKSTVLESISYAFYDKIVRTSVNTDKTGNAGLSVVTRINNKYVKEMKESYVEVIFEANDKIFFIKRGRTFTKTKNSNTPMLEFRCLNDSQSSHRKGDTQDAINEVLNMDYDVFCNSVLFGQNDAGKFVSGTDKVKKEMIVSLLNLGDTVDGCLENIRNKKNAKEKEIIGIKSQINLLMVNLSKQKTLAEIRVLIDDSKKKLIEISKSVLDSEQKLEKLIKSDEISKIEQISKEGKRVKEELKNKKDDLDNQTKEWQDLINKTDLSIKQHNESLVSTNEKISEINTQIKTKSDLISKFNLSNEQKKLEEIEKKKVLKKEKDLLIQEYNDKHHKLSLEVREMETLHNQHANNASKLMLQLKNFKDDSKFECSECKSLVSKDHVESKIKEYKDKCKEMSEPIMIKKVECEKILILRNKTRQEIDLIDSEINKSSDISNGIKQWEMDKVRLEELNSNLQDQTKNKQNLLSNLEGSKKQRNDLFAKTVEIEKKHADSIEKLQRQIKELVEQYKNAENNAKSIKEQISKITDEKQNLLKEKSIIDSFIGALNKEIEVVKEIGSKIGECQKTQDILEKEFKRLVILEDIYGLEGVQTRIVAKYLPLLNAYIKEFIDILTNGNMGVEVFINEKLKVDISIRGGTSDTYVMLSGGEKVLVKLAVSIGLGLLAFSRCSHKPEMIMLDEVLGSLDNSHTSAVFKMLHALKNKFSRILIISHKPQINDIIERKIIIEKDLGDWGMSEIKKAI